MPAIIWNDNIPQSTDEPSDSQPQLLQNNQNLPVWTAVDHYEFTSNNAGKHKQVTMPELVVAPTTLADEGALYTKQGTLSTVTELFFRRESNGAEINMTQAGGGFSYLPSGLLVKWGSDSRTGYAITIPNPGSNKVFFPAGPGIPAFTTLLFIIVSPRANADNQLNFNRTAVLAAASPDTLGFYVNCFQLTNGNSATTPFVWFAIGT